MSNKEKPKNKANRSLLINITLNNASKDKILNQEAQNLFLACLAMASSFLFRSAFSLFSLSSSARAS